MAKALSIIVWLGRRAWGFAILPTEVRALREDVRFLMHFCPHCREVREEIRR
jgi:hypothetical protein